MIDMQLDRKSETQSDGFSPRHEPIIFTTNSQTVLNKSYQHGVALSRSLPFWARVHGAPPPISYRYQHHTAFNSASHLRVDFKVGTIDTKTPVVDITILSVFDQKDVDQDPPEQRKPSDQQRLLREDAPAWCAQLCKDFGALRRRTQA